MIEIKSAAQLKTMDAANRVVRTILCELEERAKPGATTAELNSHAERRLAELGARSAFRGYPHPNGGAPFPAVLCTSINDEIVHGIPEARRLLKRGDILSLDFGAVIDGLYGDAAVTLPIGEIGDEAKKLIEVTRTSLMKAIEQVRPGNRVRDIGAAVQGYVESHGFAVIRSFVGHGIGRRLHEDPAVPNYVDTGPNPRLASGMVLAIEPMIAAGGYDIEVDDDGWTARTRDRGLSAHYELSVAVTDNGPWVLGEIETKAATGERALR